MPSILIRSSLRYIWRHPWQFLLSVLGILLGVAVVISIDMANESAGVAFNLSAESVSGKATHQITGPPGGLREEIYKKLRIEKKIRPLAPVVEGYVMAVDYPGTNFHVMGIDPLVDNPFRPYLADFGNEPVKEMAVLITTPSTGMISDSMAEKLGLKAGEKISLRAGSIKKEILIAGLIKPGDDLSKRAMENLLLTDISTAQELLDMTGRLSRIDLIIEEGKEGEKLLENIQKNLPKEANISTAESRSNTIRQMTRAFNINLTAMSMLALLVGMFLIYNTMTFSVVQRRRLTGILRAVGVTRKEIFILILGEALITGILGTITGIPAGILLGKGMVYLVTQAINDIYFVLMVTEITIPPLSLLKGILLGICATLAAALVPALEATGAPPGTVMSRSAIERGFHGAIYKTALTGMLLMAAGSGTILIAGKSLKISIISLFIIVIGYSFLTPVYTVIISRFAGFIMKPLFGITGQMSVRSITASLSRTAVAIAALMIALSVTIGVGIMVASLKYAVTVWMDNFLKADIYVSPPGMVYSRSDLIIDPPLVETLCKTPGVSEVITFRGVMMESSKGLFELVAMDIVPEIYDSLRFKKGNPETAWRKLEKGNSLIISETYAYKYNSDTGSVINLITDRGNVEFYVEGVFYDYTYEGGVVITGRKTYEKYWNDRGVSSLGIYVEPGINTDELVGKMKERAGKDQVILIQSNRGLRETSLSVFDRTFTITKVLRILAMIVAFIGILSALMALQLEREREMAVLRATGLTPAQLWKLVILQTLLMGIFAGLMALLLGIILAVILIFVINRISFGWTMEMVVEPALLIQAIILSIVASIIAGIYPAIKMSQASPAQALRNE